MSLSTCLIGFGRMGRIHALAMQSLGLGPHAIVDPNISLQDLDLFLGSTKRWPILYNSLTQLLQAGVPDLVVIATTADLHASLAAHAIKAGVRYVLLEKPVAVSMFLCQQLVELALQNHAAVAVNHQMRFMPQYLLPGRLLSSESFGGLRSMHVSAGNFGLSMNGTHYFEAFRVMSGEPPATVSAYFDLAPSPNPRGPQFQDVSGCIRVSTSSGCRLYIDASSDQGHGVQATYMARNGRITVDELTGSMTSVVRIAEHRDAPTSRYGMPVDVDHHQLPPVQLLDSTKAVLHALMSGEDYPSLDDATLAVKTLVAAYHSHRQGGVPVRLADIADDDPEVFPWA